VIHDEFPEFTFRVEGNELVFACLGRFDCGVLLLQLLFEMAAARGLGLHSYYFAKFIINFISFFPKRINLVRSSSRIK
jgi:hypothetical protein